MPPKRTRASASSSKVKRRKLFPEADIKDSSSDKVIVIEDSPDVVMISDTPPTILASTQRLRSTEIPLDFIPAPSGSTTVSLQDVKHESGTLLPVETSDRPTCELAYKNFKQSGMIGAGSYGQVFELCDPNYQCPYVLKVQFLTPAAMQEVQTQILVHDKLKITPAVIDYWTCKNASGRRLLLIVMERIHGTLMDILVTVSQSKVAPRPTFEGVEFIIRSVKSLLEKLHKLKIAHLDIHEKNIFFRHLPTGEIQFLLGDWGRAKPLDKHTNNLDNIYLNHLMSNLWLLAYGRAHIGDLRKK